MARPKVLSLIHDDVPVAMAQPAGGTVLEMNVVQATGLCALLVDGLDPVLTLQFQARSPLGDLSPCLAAQAVEALVNFSASCQMSARSDRVMFRPRPARRARKYSVRETTAWPRITCVHSS